MRALREEGNEKKVQHCQVATETSPHRQSWKSGRCWYMYSSLDAQVKCQGYFVQFCGQALIKRSLCG